MSARTVRALLIANVLVLCVLGLIMMYSAGSYNALLDAETSPLEEVMTQGAFMMLGLAAMFGLSFLDYRALRKPLVLFTALFLSIGLLCIVLVPGIGVYLNGSRRWIKLPVIPVTIQPGEIGKFILVYYTAHMIAREEIPKRQFFTRTAVPVLAVTVLMFGLVMLQPNLSTAGCMVLIVGAMLMVGGLTWKQTALLVGLGLAAFFVLAYSEEYRANRMMSFLDPWSYDGAEAYQLVQSLLAVASGGLFGVGLGNSRQKLQFLPYCDSDFIFSIICEELGFVGTTIILLLFLSLIVLGIHVATHARDRFGSMLAMGISTLFAIQVCINVLVVLGRFPTTGLPLPFFSSGGTNLIMFLAEQGLLLSIVRDRVLAEKYGEDELDLNDDYEDIPLRGRAGAAGRMRVIRGGRRS